MRYSVQRLETKSCRRIRGVQGDRIKPKKLSKYTKDTLLSDFQLNKASILGLQKGEFHTLGKQRHWYGKRQIFKLC